MSKDKKVKKSKNKELVPSVVPANKVNIKEGQGRSLDLVYRPVAPDDLILNTVSKMQLMSILADATKEESPILPACIGLFGDAGRGKTTIGRMVARVLNAEDHDPVRACESNTLMDIEDHPAYKEYNCANMSVDNIRDISKYFNMRSKYKYRVYFFDEVHRLNTHCINALLKYLEEPPENTLFILATNLPESITSKDAVLSRCDKISISAPDSELIQHRLSAICMAEGETCFPASVLRVIADNCDNRPRIAVKNLAAVISQVRISPNISEKDLISYAESISSSVTCENPEVADVAQTLLQSIYSGSPAKFYSAVSSMKDTVRVAKQMMWLNTMVIGSACGARTFMTNHAKAVANTAKAKKQLDNLPLLGELQCALVQLNKDVISGGGIPPDQHFYSLLEFFQ